MFIDDEALCKLTGFRQKAKQIAQLRKIGVAFYVNASGHPVVTEAAIQGAKKHEKATPRSRWEPPWAASLP